MPIEERRSARRAAGGEQPPPVDLADTLAEFAHEYPAWIGRDGMPLSWAHYVVGMRQLGAAAARESLRLAIAGRLAEAKADDWKAWLRETRLAARL